MFHPVLRWSTIRHRVTGYEVPICSPSFRSGDQRDLIRCPSELRCLTRLKNVPIRWEAWVGWWSFPEEYPGLLTGLANLETSSTGTHHLLGSQTVFPGGVYPVLKWTPVLDTPKKRAHPLRSLGKLVDDSRSTEYCSGPLYLYCSRPIPVPDKFQDPAKLTSSWFQPSSSKSGSRFFVGRRCVIHHEVRFLWKQSSSKSGSRFFVGRRCVICHEVRFLWKQSSSKSGSRFFVGRRCVIRHEVQFLWRQSSSCQVPGSSQAVSPGPVPVKFPDP